MNASDYADIIAGITTLVVFLVVSATILILVKWWYSKSHNNR